MITWSAAALHNLILMVYPPKRPNGYQDGHDTMPAFRAIRVMLYDDETLHRWHRQIMNNIGHPHRRFLGLAGWSLGIASLFGSGKLTARKF